MHPGAEVNRAILLRSVVQTKLGPAKVRNRRFSANFRCDRSDLGPLITCRRSHRRARSSLRFPREG